MDDLTSMTTEQIQKPAFLFGSTRSGTSILTAALKDCTPYKGFPEGHIVGLFKELNNAVNNYFEQSTRALSNSANFIHHLSAEYVSDRLCEVIRRAYSDFHQGPHFVDKTPRLSTLHQLADIKKIWPDVRFIYCKRRAIENVASKIRKWPTVPFASHCRMWEMHMSKWLEIRDSFGDITLVIDQLSICRFPQKVADAIGKHLNLAPEEVNAISNYFRTNTPEQTGIIDAVYDLDTIEWSVPKKRMFKKICQPIMNTYGYTTDTRYIEPGYDTIL